MLGCEIRDRIVLALRVHCEVRMVLRLGTTDLADGHGWFSEKGWGSVVAPDAERFSTVGGKLTKLNVVGDWVTLARVECMG